MAHKSRPVQVACFLQGEGCVGFLPFHYSDNRKAIIPVAHGMNDYQGIISGQTLAIDPLQILEAAGASLMPFDHQYPADDAAWGRYELKRQQSPQLDVRGGLEGYKARLDKTGTGELSSSLRLGRKMGRELGELRFVFDDPSPEAMDKLVAWKTAQYIATGAELGFNKTWRRELLANCRNRQSPDFGGVLSTLYAGDELVAVHYYLRAGSVLHSWFPAYDESHARYSPGRVLLAQTVEAAPALGLELIDLGRGAVTYKLRAMTQSVWLSEGYVDSKRFRGWLRRCWVLGVARIKASAWYERLRQFKRQLTRR